ncbi:MAG: hypothetical protein ABFD16_14575, partial [Thermoguttaceae bacterium]
MAVDPMFSYETAGYQRVKQSALDFVLAMKVGEEPGRYRKEPGGDESFYGSYHGLHILDLFGELDAMPAADLDTWAECFLSRQSEYGFFAADPAVRKQSLTLTDMESHWHFTRGNLWSLRLLNRPPRHPLRFIDPLLEPKNLYRWVKQYDWSNSWAAANQLLACGTALMAARDWFGASDVNRALELGMYPALEELLDEKTGFWGTQLGADLPNGLFGTIHVTPIYFA